MKVVLFNSSPRVGAVTEQSLNIVKDELEAAGIETEIIWIFTNQDIQLFFGHFNASLAS